MRRRGTRQSRAVSVPATHAPTRPHWRRQLLTIGAVSNLVCARGAIVSTFGLGLCFAVFNAYQVLAARDPSGVAGLIGLSMLLLAAGVVALAIHLARRDKPLPARWFVPVALLAALAIRLAYYAMVDPAWVSDFATYWKIANELAGADHYQVVNLYQQRAMPYLVPIVEIFGDSPDGVKLANIAVLCLIQLLGYDILRRCHGHSAAQCFTVLWIGAPEPLYSALIPSHDLVAMGQVAIVLWLTVVATTRKRAGGLPGARFALYALPIAIMLAALEVERGIGRILLAALLLVGVAGMLVKSRFPSLIAGDSGQPKRLLLVALLSLPLYAACMQGLAGSRFSAADDVSTAAMLRYTTAHATSLSNGSYKWMRAFHDTFTIAYAKDSDRFADLRTSLALSDFAESPLQRTDNAVTRLGDLYSLGGSIGFYSSGVAKKSPNTAAAMLVYNAAFALLLALLALYGLLRLLVRPRFPLVAGVLLVMVSVMTLILVLIAENQPRYLYIAWFVAAATAALGIARAQGADDPGTADPEAPAATALAMGWMVLQSFLAIFCIGAAAWVALELAYDAKSGRILSHWALSAYPPAATAPGTDWTSDLKGTGSDVLWAADKRYRVASMDFGPLALTLQLPKAPAIGDRVVASAKVCTRGGARNDLAFFVYTPYKNLKRRGAFELEVTVDGDPKWRLALPHADKPMAIEIPDLVPANACSDLAFTLHSKVAIPRESWRRASRVEIYFPRLVDTVR